ncbi:MAG: delta-60 repeat domain-containing protein [Saprospiraceae bacterium]|nr:delta-60 repeat domain-containing protein [Candidatus Brachybacter algidus]
MVRLNPDGSIDPSFMQLLEQIRQTMDLMDL